jgi:type-F conjugative transfer system pilin assembly protein TrbC
LLFPLKTLFVVLSLSIFAHAWGEESKPIVISKENQDEALRIREHAQKYIETHKAEAMSKAFEAKEIVQNVIREARGNNNSPPCFSTNNTAPKGCAVIKPNAYALSSKTTSVNASTRIVVFVSFSMPEESLKALFKEADKNPHVRLVLRGLVEDSMEKTAKKIHELEGVINVDPELFERYQIEHVPTFMWVKQGEPLGKLMGNITLRYAQEIFDAKFNTESSSS